MPVSARTAHAPFFAAALATTFTLVACGHPVQRKLEGRWLGEAVENFDESQLASATGWARGVSFEFAGANVTVGVPAEEPRRGRYRVGAVHQDDVTLAFTSKEGKTENAAFKLDGEHSLRWLIGAGRSIVLRRAP